jgi:hypothetical protein
MILCAAPGHAALHALQQMREHGLGIACVWLGCGAASIASLSSIACSSGTPEAKLASVDPVELRRATFSGVASALGLASDDDSCLYSASELTSIELQPNTSRNSLTRYWGCLALRDNIERDSLAGCLPEPSVALAGRGGRAHIEGTLAYMGFVALPYRYDLDTDDDGHARVRLRVHYYGKLAEDPGNLRHMARKLDRAAELWTQNAPAADFDGPPISFVFQVVAAPEQAHFSVELAPRCPRSPYLVAHGLDCSAHFLAHELGHMLGLDDEYNQIRKTAGHILGSEWWWARDARLRTATFRCDISSLMCSSRFDASTPRSYDYYLILRRRLCQRAPIVSHR